MGFSPNDQESAVKEGIHPKYTQSSPVRLRHDLEDAIDQARAAPRNLLELPPFFTGQSEAD